MMTQRRHYPGVDRPAPVASIMTKSVIMESLRPGLNVQLVTDMDCARETICVRTATVYDVSGNTVIVSQTDPPLGPSVVDRVINVTYVRKEKGNPERHGFSARVRGFVNHVLSGGSTVRALHLERQGGPEPFSIRMFHRMEPSRSTLLRLFVGGSEVTILDVSLGGMRFGYGGKLSLQAGTTEDINLDIGQKSYNLKARICRTWEKRYPDNWKEDRVASLEFVALPTSVERMLVRTLHQMERESRNKEEP
jgi:hypothetical protein